MDTSYRKTRACRRPWVERLIVNTAASRFCELWDITNLDTGRRVTRRFCSASYRTQHYGGTNHLLVGKILHQIT